MQINCHISPESLGKVAANCTVVRPSTALSEGSCISTNGFGLADDLRDLIGEIVQISWLIFVNNLLDAQLFFMYVYFYSLHVSGCHVQIISRINTLQTGDADLRF